MISARIPDLLRLDLRFINFRQVRFLAISRCAFASNFSVDKRSQHIIVWYARQVAGRMQAWNRSFRMFVDPYARCGVAAAQADFGNMHFDHLLAVISSATL